MTTKMTIVVAIIVVIVIMILLTITTRIPKMMISSSFSSRVPEYDCSMICPKTSILGHLASRQRGVQTVQAVALRGEKQRVHVHEMNEMAGSEPWASRFGGLGGCKV